MNNYITSPNEELYHYGVKGMKWGVRRSIQKRAIAAATAKKRMWLNDNDITLLEAKQKRKEKRNKSLSARQTRKLDKLKKEQTFLKDAHAKLIKDLDNKDIEQGIRYVRTMHNYIMNGSHKLNDRVDINMGLKELNKLNNTDAIKLYR